ncbi:porin [Phyllobacterium sp. SB3]|uniref:porin n=1 Tax=Phyllobacterium sp. SB3 TaxID=3156073 RepID=UPI0032AFC6BE
MNIKSCLLASAATLVAFTSARAADAVVVAEPEPVEYVRVCDTYGEGFFYIPGTETCLRISGYLRYDAQAGDDVYSGGELDTWAKQSRATLRFDARTETELGTLRSYADVRFNFTDGENGSGSDLHQGYIELGGFQVGVNDPIFGSWLGDAGDIINDDVIQYSSDSFSTNEIRYTYVGGNGFSAVIAAEQGNNENDYDYTIDDYMPHVAAGAKFEQNWGSIGGIVGYDAVTEAVGVKARLDVKVNDVFSVWAMAGYQSDYDQDSFGTNSNRNWYGQWEGDWAAWAGFAAKVSDKATINGQGAYEDEGTYAFALNVGYELVPGFTITPEVNYTKFDGARKDQALADGGDDNAFGGIIRFQRDF